MVAEGKAQETAVVAQAPRIRRLNIIGRRNLFFAFSLLIIIPGIFSMWRNGFLLGIDFAGGTEFTVSFANRPSLALVESAVAAETLNGSVIETSGGGYIVRYPPLNAASQVSVQHDLENRLGPMKVDQILEVGGTIAGESIEFSLLAVVAASVAILCLLAWRVPNTPRGLGGGFSVRGV